MADSSSKEIDEIDRSQIRRFIINTFNHHHKHFQSYEKNADTAALKKIGFTTRGLSQHFSKKIPLSPQQNAAKCFCPAYLPLIYISDY